MSDIITCSICKRETPIKLTERHHLIPVSIKRRNKYAKLLKSIRDETINVCCNCGDYLHEVFTEKELAETYNTLEKILDCDKMHTWVRWIQKKPNDFSVCMKTKKKR